MRVIIRVSFLIAYSCHALKVQTQAVLEADADVTKSHLILIRTTPGNLKKSGVQDRIQKYTKDIEQNLPFAHLLVAVDETNGKAEVDLPTENVYRYTFDQVFDTYPSVRLAHAHLMKVMDVGANVGRAAKHHVKETPGRYFYAEPLIMAWKYAQQMVPNLMPEKIWSIEDDVFFCGNLSVLVKEYSDDDSDFLGYGSTLPIHNWPLNGAGTPEFKKRYKLDNRKFGWTFIQRFSSKFLQLVEHLSRDLNITAQCELYPGSVCANDRSCTMREYDQKHIGKAAFNLRVHTQEQVNKICVNKTSVTFNHAAKF